MNEECTLADLHAETEQLLRLFVQANKEWTRAVPASQRSAFAHRIAFYAVARVFQRIFSLDALGVNLSPGTKLVVDAFADRIMLTFGSADQMDVPKANA